MNKYLASSFNGVCNNFGVRYKFLLEALKVSFWQVLDLS